MVGSCLELVYETSNASIHQCDLSEKYELKFFDQALTLRPCELLTFKRKILAIDVVELLTQTKADVELVRMPSCDRLFVFSIQEVLELRDLIDGAFTMLELNSLIHRQLVRQPSI